MYFNLWNISKGESFSSCTRHEGTGDISLRLCMPQNKSCHVVKQGYRVLGKSFNDSSCLQNSLPTWLSPSLALWQCCGKVAAEIFIDNAIRCREKSQDVGYEVLLRWRESVPVCGIRREVDLLGSPKGRFGLFVRPPDVVALDGEEDETIEAHLP